MKPLKILGLAGLAATALMAFAPGASATNLTSPAGTNYTGTIKVENEGGIQVHDDLIPEWCTSSKFEWKVESHGAAATAKGAVTSFSMSECEFNTTISLVKPGSFEVHTHEVIGEKSGALTWVGAELTTQTHNPFLGTIHCLYAIGESTPPATLTGSQDQGMNPTATLDTEVVWNRVGGSAFCDKTTEWTAEYVITSPHYLDVD